MSSLQSADVAVVGGGIVGLAMADAVLNRHPDARVVVFEKESSHTAHASGRNSGVLHAGFYYAPETLKAALTRRGNELLSEFCVEQSLSLRRCGKVVVATGEEQLPDLQRLLDRGVANGVDVQRISIDELGELEPLARTHGWALWSPTTSVADPAAVTRALADRVVTRGGRIHLDSPVTAGAPGRLTVGGEPWEVGHVINAAGLYADRVAGWFGFCEDYVVLPFKGLYWYSDWPSGTLKRLVYPVPDARNPFLGVHLTVTVDGRTKLGPTAIPALSREDYGGLSGYRRDEVAEITRQFPRFLTSPHHDVPALIRSELPKYWRRELVRQARTLVPSVTSRRFRIRGTPGVRAQLWSIPDRQLEMDFVVRGDERSTHLLNVVSPGWTSSMAVAEHVVGQLAEQGVL